MDGSPLSDAFEPAKATPVTGAAGESGNPETPELDLDRLVWDPEYRNAMRHLIKRDS